MQTHKHPIHALVGVARLEEAHEEGVGRADGDLELERREHERLHVDDLGYAWLWWCGGEGEGRVN
jgi:hypothetical protein